jgi:hypothetical protein
VNTLQASIENQNTMYKTACLLVALIVVITSGCKKSTTNTSQPPVIRDTTKPYIGEVNFNTINGEDLSCKSILKTSDNAWLDPYPAFFKINSDLKVTSTKIPLTSDAAAIHQAVETNDGFYLLGQIQPDYSQTTFNNLLLIKTNKSGSVLWKRQYDNIKWVYSLIKTNDNQLAILAYNGGSWLPNYVSDKAPTILLKLDMDGNVVFRKDFVQEGLHYGSTDLVETNSGYAFVAYKRVFDSTTGLGSLAAQFCKIDKAGNIISKTDFDGFNIQYMRATHLVKKVGGGFIVSHFPSQKGGFNSYLYYLDEEGNRTHLGNLFEGNSNNEMWDIAGIKQSDDGSVYVLAVDLWSINAWAIIMKRFDAQGVLIKTKKYYIDGYARALEKTTDGNFIIASDKSHGISLLKINKDLEVL